MFATVVKKPEASNRFFGALTGSVPLPEFFAPRNLFKIMGIAEMRRVLLS